jgi:HSP20 family protein
MSISDLIPWRERDRSMPVRRRSDSVSRLQSEFDRFFNDFASLTPWSTFESIGDFSPEIDVTEHDDRLEVTAELPGLNFEDIDLTISRDTLTIKGEKKQETEVDEGNYYRMERRFGSFCRTIPFAADVVDADNVDASYKDGLLKITLPKRKEAQPLSKRINISQR